MYKIREKTRLTGEHRKLKCALEVGYIIAYGIF